MLDPGKPSFTPKKGKTSVVMFVGLQGMFLARSLSCVLDHSAVFIDNLWDCFFGKLWSELALWALYMLWLIHGSKICSLFRVYCFLLFMHILLSVWQIQGREKPQHVQNMHTIIRKRAGGLPLCVQIHSELVLLISWSRMPLKLRFHFTEGTSFVFYCLFVCTSCDVIEA